MSIAQPLLEVTVEPDRRWIRLAVRGELDLATAPQISEAISELRETGFSAFELDLRTLGFIDSSGLRLLLDLDRDPDLELAIRVTIPSPVHRVLELAGVDGILPLTRRPVQG